MESGEKFDVIIVGAGPGGSALAAFLGKEGRKVLLLEKSQFPRDKTCGDAVGGKCTKILRELGISADMEKNPHAKISGVVFSNPKGTHVTIPFPKNKEGKQNTGYVCRRYIYDNFLFENVKKYPSVKVIQNFTVADVIREGDSVVGVKGAGQDRAEKSFYAKIVAGADGATSIVAKKLGLGEIDDNHHCLAVRAYYKGVKGITPNIELHFIKSVLPGYFWIFPADDGKANVGLGMITKDVKKDKKNLPELMKKIIEEEPVFKERFADAQIMGNIQGWSLPFGSKRRRAHGNGFVLLGDAASLIDPFTGEGVGNAMTSAFIAAPVISKALETGDTSQQALSVYEEKLWVELGPELQNSYNLQKAGRMTFLLNFIIDKAAKNPELQQAISGMLGDEEAKKQLISPLFYLKVLLT